MIIFLLLICLNNIGWLNIISKRYRPHHIEIHGGIKVYGTDYDFVMLYWKQNEKYLPQAVALVFARNRKDVIYRYSGGASGCGVSLLPRDRPHFIVEYNEGRIELEYSQLLDLLHNPLSPGL